MPAAQASSIRRMPGSARTPPSASEIDPWVEETKGGVATAGEPAALALGLHEDGHLGRLEGGVDANGDLVRAELLQRVLELDLVAVDGDPPPGERLGDVLGGDRAEELPALPDLHAHRERRAGDASRLDPGLLALPDALLLAVGDVVLPRPIGTAGGRHGQLARDEEVSGEAVGHVLEVAALADGLHVGGEDDLHPADASGPADAAGLADAVWPADPSGLTEAALLLHSFGRARPLRAAARSLASFIQR